MPKKILIISHTEHYLRDGKPVGWGPTVREIDHVAAHFGEVIHIACLHPALKAPPSAVSYQNPNVKFVPIPTYGGMGFRNKLSILKTAPKIIRTVWDQLQLADVFQFRAPTSMGVYLIPLLILFTRKKGWFKYAGNWVQKNPPISYAWQRFWLKWLNKRKVTINGRWHNQQSHLISFENPCLEVSDREEGKIVLASKTYIPPFTGCFVGRLEDAKGVRRIIEAGLIWKAKGFQTIHLIGDGPFRVHYEALAAKQPIQFIFHGFLNKESVFEICKKSHFFFLPSTASEGFPKVIAEAANFGCIPIVSDVSSIGHYINTNNGHVWSPSSAPFSSFIERINITDKNNLIIRASKAYDIADLFTFERYIMRISNEIIQ